MRFFFLWYQHVIFYAGAISKHTREATRTNTLCNAEQSYSGDRTMLSGEVELYFVLRTRRVDIMRVTRTPRCVFSSVLRFQSFKNSQCPATCHLIGYMRGASAVQTRESRGQHSVVYTPHADLHYSVLILSTGCARS